MDKEDDLRLRRINESSAEMSGKTVGIVGLGRNGMGLAARCRAFQMHVVGYDPYVDKRRSDILQIYLATLEELFSVSDFVVLMARVTDETRHMINRKLLGRMKQDACLINTARAALVDTQALEDVLKEGRIKAALDVFDPAGRFGAVHDSGGASSADAPSCRGQWGENCISVGETIPGSDSLSEWTAASQYCKQGSF